MHRRPNLIALVRSLLYVVVAAFVLGPGWAPEVRLFGVAYVVIAVRNWRRYWRAHDEFEAWRKKVGQ